MKKIVEKVVENMWMKDMKMVKMWNSHERFWGFYTYCLVYKQVIQKYFDMFCTQLLSIFNLLNTSFPCFAQTTTNTTTIFINKGNNI